MLTFALSFNLGYYDLATQVDYILSETKRPKLNYVGFSQGKSEGYGFIVLKLLKVLISIYFHFLGTTQFFILNSMRPEYNEKFIEGEIYSLL